MFKKHDSRDRELGMHRSISRRDFLNGISVALTSSVFPTSAVAAFQVTQARENDNYPPTRTGMRGSHAGSFEVAHEMRDGKTWDNPEAVDEP